MPAYCTTADLGRWGVQSAALAPVALDVQQAAIDSASAVVDTYLRARYSLPLKRWGDDVRRWTAILAAYDLMVVRGYNPDAGADSNLRLRHEDTLGQLRGVSRQDVHPDVTPCNASTSPFYDAPAVLTHPPRGW